MNSSQHLLVHHFLEKSASGFPDKCAVLHDTIKATYEEINSGANRLARWLISLGINKGDKIAFILENSIEYVITYYGIMKAGAVAVPLNTELKPESLRPLLNELENKIIITSAKYEKLLQDSSTQDFSVRNLLIVNPQQQFPKPLKTFKWDEIVTKENCPDINLPIAQSDLASIIYTSGSTGKPKGVMLTHGNLTSNTRSICEFLKLTGDDIQMAVLPFFYVMGKSLLNTHFAVGGKVIINNKFAFPASVIRQMIDEKVTGFSGVPSTYAYLLHRSPLAKSRDKLTSLRYCSQAGGHMSKQIKQDLRRALPDHTEIFIMYGATEASARLTYLDPARFNDKIESIGKAIPGTAVKVLDENGQETTSGITGEIVGSGPNIMQGYFKDPETSSKVLDHNGYHTGDLGYRDEEGFLYLVGRKDNLLKVGGHRINPQEVEDALMETGLVMEAAVIGIPDELLGNKLYAVVNLITEGTNEKDIIEKCAYKLPKYKLPGDIKIIKSLPKHPSGKIDKKKCREFIPQ